LICSSAFYMDYRTGKHCEPPVCYPGAFGCTAFCQKTFVHLLSTNTSKFPTEAVERVATSAHCVSALLSVIAILPEAKQHDTLKTCASMAEQIAHDLAALVGGAA
jgi:hypothetical protein